MQILKSGIRATAALFIILISCGHAVAQTTSVNQPALSSVDEHKDLQSDLLPLEQILDIAIKNSASVKFQADLVEAAKSQLEFSKRVWTNNIMGFVNYSAGNQNIVSSDSQSPGNVAASNITNGYRMGIQVNLPLYELVGRKARVNLYKYQLNSTVDKRDESVQELKKIVIQLYYSLLYYNNLLNIRSDAKQSAVNQVMVAQKQFKDGVIDLTELSRLKTFEVNARADYEEAKREFSIAWFQMEPVVGMPVQQLMRK